MEHSVTFLTVDQWVTLNDLDPLIYAHVFSGQDRATARVATCSCGWELMGWGTPRLVETVFAHVRPALLAAAS